MDFSVDFQPVKSMTVSAEYATSQSNANRFSDLPGVITSGGAMKFGLSYNPRNVTIDGADIGGFDIQLNDRRVGKLFTPIDRTNDIEFTRK
jgi:hypothetical protein